MGAPKELNVDEYRRLILEIIEDMEFLASTFNSDLKDETKRAYKSGQKDACLKWAQILRERLNDLEEKNRG